MTDQITGILALVGALTGVVSLFRIRNIKHQIDDFISHELDNRIHLKFNEMYNKKMRNESTQTDVSYITQPFSTPKQNNEVNTAVIDSQPAHQPIPVTPKSEETPVPVVSSSEENKEEDILPSTVTKLEAPITLYASIYKNKSFKRVSTTSDDYTIYNITTSPSVPTSGVITIDVNAYSKVGTTPDFLDEACIVSGNGSDVKVIKPGTVTKEGENWIVTEQIEVELN